MKTMHGVRKMGELSKDMEGPSRFVLKTLTKNTHERRRQMIGRWKMRRENLDKSHHSIGESDPETQTKGDVSGCCNATTLLVAGRGVSEVIDMVKILIYLSCLHFTAH